VSVIAAQLSLERLYLAAMVGAKRLSVRLRPELKHGESLHILNEVGKQIDKGALDGDLEAAVGFADANRQPA